MKEKIRIAAIILTISCNSFSQSNLYDYSLKEVHKNIYVTVRKEPLRHAVEGNFVIIVNEQDVVVIDAGGSAKAARLAINDIKKITSKPVTCLINTHFHGDHTFGNQEYKKAFPRLEIIATRPTADVMFKRAQSFSFYLLNDSIFNKRISDMDTQIIQLKKEKVPDTVIANLQRHKNKDLPVLRELYSEVTITPPTLVFNNELLIKRGTREIRVLFLGSGDTPGDAWIHLPKEKILITGDAVVHPVPYGFSADPVMWMKTLEKAAELDFEIMIPGHGEVQYGKAYLLQLIELLKALIAQTEQLSQQQKPKEEIKKAIDIKNIEQKFTRQDPLLTYYFAEYFKNPIIETLAKRFVKVQFNN